MEAGTYGISLLNIYVFLKATFMKLDEGENFFYLSDVKHFRSKLFYLDPPSLVCCWLFILMPEHPHYFHMTF